MANNAPTDRVGDLRNINQDMRERLSAQSIFERPTYWRIAAGINVFCNGGSNPLPTLDVVLDNTLSYMDGQIAGHETVEHQHVEYCRRVAGWLIAFRDRLCGHGRDVPVMTRYVENVQRAIINGTERPEALEVEPGMSVFAEGIRSIQESERDLDVGELESPGIYRVEGDSDEVAWVKGFHWEMLETLEVFRDALAVFREFEMWALKCLEEA